MKLIGVISDFVLQETKRKLFIKRKVILGYDVTTQHILSLLDVRIKGIKLKHRRIFKTKYQMVAIEGKEVREFRILREN